jgi:nicotinamide-nucleotide amidase
MIERAVADLLRRKKMTLAVAESCTGGLICHSLTNVPGSSSYFLLGVIAYANEAKAKILGIDPRLIKAHGAVSREVALEMAKSVKHLAAAHVGLAVTGIAGPAGATAAKPVGTVFIAISLGHHSFFKKFFFPGGRLAVKKASRDAALQLLKTCLLQERPL